MSERRIGITSIMHGSKRTGADAAVLRTARPVTPWVIGGEAL